MRVLAQEHGQSGWHGHAIPLSVHGIEIVASLVLLADHESGRRSGSPSSPGHPARRSRPARASVPADDHAASTQPGLPQPLGALGLPVPCASSPDARQEGWAASQPTTYAGYGSIRH